MGDSKEFLEALSFEWKQFTIFVFAMRKIFDYLDRYHLKNKGGRNLTESCLDLYRKQIFDESMSQIRRSIFDEIAKDREYEIVDKELIKAAIQQFIFMGFSKQPAIKKIEGSNNPLRWTGEKNL